MAVSNVTKAGMTALSCPGYIAIREKVESDLVTPIFTLLPLMQAPSVTVVFSLLLTA